MMGAGMNYHLGVNSILREIFELGAPLNLLDASAHKLSKTERVSRKLNLKSGQCVLVDTGMMGETTCLLLISCLLFCVYF